MSPMLSPRDLELLDELFERAADLPPEKHAAFVERECAGNQALQAELELLLAGLTGEDVVSRLRPEIPSRAGTRIGDYRLIERVGEGGMGEVYAADQLEPVTRRVALKLIKPGMDSTEVVTRFHAERQALARMEHPNIARVFDAGATKDERPYFVMEFVEGCSITEHCDRQGLSTSDRVQLFLEVCEGVQHAHQKGIIHRDLKPSNLLVATEGEKSVAKIIDFGVARATTGKLTDRTLHTTIGQIVGTLDYMSPEQANPAAIDVDTRTDIYSLGVVLYELVTGLLPYERELSAPLGSSGTPLAHLDKDPLIPSLRLKRSSHKASELAALRGVNENAHLRQLNGDLDWICLKALERDPERRYASASELADDLERHLRNEPVLAGKPGALYRANKFFRRNRARVLIGGLVAAASLVAVYVLQAARYQAAANAKVALALEPLADAYRQRKLTVDADELWPAHPKMIPALQEWIQEARLLVERLPEYTDDRDALRQNALAWSEAERFNDWANYDRLDELEYYQAELERRMRVIEGGLTGEALEAAYARVDELESRASPMELERGVRRTWSFTKDSDQAQHEMLSDLVAGLEALRNDLLDMDAVSKEHGWSVLRRIRVARELQSSALSGAHAAAWADALPAIRAAYPGLDISPQVGLIPIGPTKDPKSGLWEFAELLSGQPAHRGADGELVRTESTGLTFVLLPAGTFLMGAQWDDPDLPNYDLAAQHGNREGPVVEVSLEAFFLSKYEMTQAQWERCTGENPSLYQLTPDQRSELVSLDPDNPVNQVSWSDCNRVLGRLGLTLPTEEQWEYGARAGTSTVWWTGDDVSTLEGAAQLRIDRSQPMMTLTKVGSYSANPFGIHDVLGNASEWCENPPYLYGTVPGSDAETRSLRVARGGSTRLGAQRARSAARFVGGTEQGAPALGLRPARGVDP